MKIFFSAGEPSGDQHAAGLMSKLQDRSSEIQFEGFGGPEMQKSGCELLYPLTDLAVMGFLRVVPMLAKFRRLVIQAEQHFDESKPDAVVLVDFPGFNWWIAKAAKKRGIPVFYYMPPQLWAWAPWRIRRVRKWVDHVICNLPFEYEWYKKRNVNAKWVGHPFFDEVAEHQLDQNTLSNIAASSNDGPVIAVLPGSRDHEVDRNFAVMLEVLKRVHQAVPNVNFVVGNYKSEHQQVCEQLRTELANEVNLTYLVDKTSEAIEAADCCLMVSGSISLELLSRKTPGVVLYRIGTFSRSVSRVMMTCPFITLTNLISEKEVMPEFISNGNPEADVQKMTAHLVEWCTNTEQRNRVSEEMGRIANEVAVTGATLRTAEYLIEQLEIQVVQPVVQPADQSTAA
ncbi:MAG: lipid-A-disaccharide synthase [Fuerstiella sp.]